MPLYAHKQKLALCWRLCCRSRACEAAVARAKLQSRVERARTYSPTDVSYGIHPTACRREKQRGRRLQYGWE
jgi:hypothetical protein